MQAPPGQMMQGGHLYMQTNEIRNCVIHYLRARTGRLPRWNGSSPAVPGRGPALRHTPSLATLQPPHTLKADSSELCRATRRPARGSPGESAAGRIPDRQ